jgi:hypothetical protein
MCLTMIDPASSWFEIVELPVMETITPIVNKQGTKTHKKLRRTTLIKPLQIVTQ